MTLIEKVNELYYDDTLELVLKTIRDIDNKVRADLVTDFKHNEDYIMEINAARKEIREILDKETH